MRGLFFAAVSLLSLSAASAAPAELVARSAELDARSAELDARAAQLEARLAELDRRRTCMPTDTANTLATAFQSLVGQTFNETLAKLAVSSDWQDYSDSVIELLNGGCPNGSIALGTPGFTSRAQWITAQETQQPIPFDILQTWPACNSVTVRWRSSAPGFVQPEEIVTGILVLQTAPSKHRNPGAYTWQITHTYSEFNSAAWLYDLGIFVPSNCSASS